MSPMKLSRYINEHPEVILAEWEAFALTLTPASSGMTRKALRDHALPMLLAIALDIETSQNESEEIEKSQGKGPNQFPNSAASIHGTLREDSGFTLVQLTAEFRALRASVLRLWLAEITDFNKEVTEDIIRFNEAVDQALAESAVTFSERGTETRDRFLAILGHDLRTPLSAISMAGELLIRSPTDASRNLATGQRLRRSSATMTAMVNDLLEYSRTQLGGKMPISAAMMDMAEVAQAAVHDARLANPDCIFDLELGSDLSGEFDAVKMQQVIMNLLANAAQYRQPGTPVKIAVSPGTDDVAISVTNQGPPIPADALETIFSAMVQLPLNEESIGRPSTSMGLGLFVAREISLAHGGTITVTSTPKDGTCFRVTVPRIYTEQAE